MNKIETYQNVVSVVCWNLPESADVWYGVLLYKGPSNASAVLPIDWPWSRGLVNLNSMKKINYIKKIKIYYECKRNGLSWAK